MPIKAQTFAGQIIERLGVETDNSLPKTKVLTSFGAPIEGQRCFSVS